MSNLTEKTRQSYRWGQRNEPPVDQAQQQALEFRKRIYRQGLRARHIHSTSPKIPHFHPLAFKSTENINKLVPWIRRDLMALVGYENVDIVKDYVVAVMKEYELRSDIAINLLKEFLDDKAEHFVHELVSFGRSPWNLETYDRMVQYGTAHTRASQTTD
jgi:E3 ubiquitin-protein ligase Topors